MVSTTIKNRLFNVSRCLASVVAVCVAISLMLQKEHFNGKHYDIKGIKMEAQRRAEQHLQEDEFPQYVSCAQ